MTVITIRGTLGAGKSTCVQRIIQHFGEEAKIYDYLNGKQRLIGHRLKGNIVVLGPYTSACGGVDRLFWQGRKVADYLVNLILTESKDNHVVFESLATSQWFDRLIEIDRQRELIAIQLTTSLDV